MSFVVGILLVPVELSRIASNAICCSCLVFGNGIACVVLALLPAVLSCFGSVVLRCVALCSVVICRHRCVALHCVAFCFLMLCAIALCPVVSLRWVMYCLLRCGVVLCCVVDKSYLEVCFFFLQFSGETVEEVSVGHVRS